MEENSPQEDLRKGTSNSGNSNNSLIGFGSQASLDDNYFSSLKLNDCKPKGEAVYFVIILGTKRVKEARGKSFFTTYKLRVFDKDGNYWVTLRRYREFRALQQKLKHEYEKDNSIPHNFPGKKIVGNMDPWHIDERHMKLQTWFNKVLSHPVLGKTDEVKIFLEEFKLSETNINNLLSDIANNNNNIANNILSSGDEDLVKLDLGRMGYLYKLHHGQWKKGWFVLRNDVLFKYRSHSEKHPYGEYLWRGVSVQEVELPGGTGLDDNFSCFMVTTTKNKKYVFATTEEDCEEWIEAINSAVDY